MEKLKEWLKTAYSDLDRYFSRDERLQIAVLLAKSNSQAKIIKDFNMIQEENKRKTFWNNKWPKGKILYKAQGDYLRDVRTLLCDHSAILKKIIVTNDLIGENDNETVCKITCWCIKNIKYESDLPNFGKMEYWAHPEIVVQKGRDDCDGYACLIKSMSLVAGVDDWKMKLCAGNVANPNNPDDSIGHAYCIYLHEGETVDNDRWVCLDGCYFPNYDRVENRIEHKRDNRYREIWWTSTREHNFIQHDTVVDGV